MRLESLWGDIRFAFRIFKRSPAVALTVIGTLAVALGLNATAYSFFNAYVVKPAAVHDPGTLYQASWENRGGFFHRFSWTEAEGFGRDMAGVFPETYVSMAQLLTRINGRPAMGELVTGNYFSLLGVPAFRGRMLRPSDSEAPGREPVVVLSHAAWMRLFGGDPAAVGQQLQIRGVYVEIVGIAPEGFVGLDLLPRDFWAPLTLLPALEEGPSLFGPEQPQRLDVVGRLGATQTEGSARAAVLAWARRTTASNPPETQAVVAILEPAATPIALSFNVLLAFTPLMVAFGLVLLTAAANLAGLMLSRATVRQREIAIRLSLGASRGRIVRQLFVESLLLALVASLAGFALGRVTLDAGIRAVYATLPPVVADYIRLLPVVPDARVLAALIAAGIGAAVLFGALPALHATRHAGTIASHGATPDGRTSRLRHGLVVAQITVSALLIVTCGVLLRGSVRLATTDLGLQTRDVIEVRTRNQSNETALATLRAHPLVRTVAAASTSTFAAGRLVIASDAWRRSLGGGGDAPSAVQVRMPQKLVSPGYFDVYEIGLVSGRHFTEAEASGGAPVVILSQQAAATLWPGQSAVGRLVRLAPDSRVPDAYKPPSPVVEVVGVARTVFTSWDQAMRATIYSPMSVAGSNLNMLVKTRGGNVSAAMRQIDADLSAAAPGVAQQIITAQDLVEARVYPFQAMSWAAGVIGGIALVLTISGIYGVLAYAVARRTKEIGIRMALGESAAGVVGLILKQSMRLCAIGLGIGLTLAVALSTALASTLVMMDTFDVAAFSAGIVIVIAACLVAAFYPARRAAGVEPRVALRIE